MGYMYKWPNCWSLWRTHEMVRTSATRPIVVVPPTQPGIRHSPRAAVAAGNWGVQTAWPHFIAFTHSRQTRKLLLLATSDGACSIRPQQTGEDLTSLTPTSPRRSMSHWPR
jgi:hypothetical protein